VKNHVRSLLELEGYGVLGADGPFGYADDFIVDEASWTLRHVVIGDGGWFSHHQVLVGAAWLDWVDWAERRIHMSLTRHMLDDAPPYDPTAPVNQKVEIRHYDYLGRPKPHL